MPQELTYTIKFVPDAYYIAPMGGGEVRQYYSIVGKESRRPVAFAFDDNTAMTICLALELVRAQLFGDTKKAQAIMGLIDKFRDMPLTAFKE